jgi:hypothetical protein
MNYIPKFIETFPELKNVSSEEMCDRFQELGIDFYTDEKVSVKWWNRFTFPFAIILMVLMLFAIPINFLLTGHWGYSLGEKNRILNWFRSLRLM